MRATVRAMSTVRAAVALVLTVLAAALLAAPAPAAPVPAAPVPAAPAPAAAPPTPVYPSGSVAPGTAATTAPALTPISDRDTPAWGDRVAADGRVVPSLGRLTESIDVAVTSSEKPFVDVDTLMMQARSLPLEGRKLMLVLDVGDEGADEAALREDARETARVMVLEYRTGMPVDPPRTGPDGFPALDPPWVVLTVVLPPAQTSDDGLEPVVHVALGTGVSGTPELAQRVEEALRGARAGTEHTAALEAAVRAAVEHTRSADELRAAAQDQPSLLGARSGWQWAVLAGLVLALAAVAVLPRLRARRAAARSVAHAPDPGRYAHAGDDPALRLRALVELGALALDVPGVRALPEARAVTAGIVEHTLVLDSLASGSRAGRAGSFRRSMRPELEDRLTQAQSDLRELVTAGRRARPALRFPDAVLEAVR